MPKHGVEQSCTKKIKTNKEGRIGKSNVINVLTPFLVFCQTDLSCICFMPSTKPKQTFVDAVFG